MRANNRVVVVEKVRRVINYFCAFFIAGEEKNVSSC